MFDLGHAGKWVAGISGAGGLALWAFGLIPWWAVPLAAAALPCIAMAALLIVGTALWMAGGSH